MKKLILVAILATLTACEAIKDEAGYLGGYPERIANTHLFDARSQRQRADRYFMSLAILAPLAADLVESDAEANAAATLINKAYTKLALMYDAANKCLSNNGTAVCGDASEAANSAFAFETHAYELQRTLYALSRQTLGNADLDDVADDILALNVIAVYKTLKKAFPIARRLLASYRDTVITFGDAVAISCKLDKEPANMPKPCMKLTHQIRQMRSGLVSKNNGLNLHDDRAIFAMLASLKTASKNGTGGQQWSLGKQHVFGLMYHIDRACRSLATEQLSDESDVASIVNCGKLMEIGKADKIKLSDSRSKFKAAAINAIENRIVQSVANSTVSN